MWAKGFKSKLTFALFALLVSEYIDNNKAFYGNFFCGTKNGDKKILFNNCLCLCFFLHRFMHGIEQQFLALQKGFNELIPQTLLKAFDERELELVIGGLGTIDLEDWRLNTRLKHCTLETQQVRVKHLFRDAGETHDTSGNLVLEDSRGLL